MKNKLSILVNEIRLPEIIDRSFSNENAIIIYFILNVFKNCFYGAT
jgi:hypothetical protein